MFSYTYFIFIMSLISDSSSPGLRITQTAIEPSTKVTKEISSTEVAVLPKKMQRHQSFHGTQYFENSLPELLKEKEIIKASINEDGQSPTYIDNESNVFAQEPTLKKVVSRKLSSEKKIFPNIVPNTGSLTPYNSKNIDSSEITYEGCTPLRSWFIARHGIRFPSHKDVIKMKTRLSEIIKLIFSSGKINPNSPCYDWSLKNWEIPKEINTEEKEVKILNERGKLEMQKMGERYRSRFKNFFPTEFDTETIKVRFTNTDRTKYSAYNFLMGLFGTLPKDKSWYEEPQEEDKILKYDSNCLKWKRDHQLSDFNEKILELYKFGKECITVTRNVEYRCGLSINTLKNDDIFLMHTMCSFEISWGIFSPWCNIFTFEEMEIIEYYEDLDLWTNHGYGDILSTQIPCVVFKDMMNHLYGTDKKKHVFYFTHLTAITKFIAFLNLYKDTIPLSHTNFSSNINRKWRVSEFGVFATNLSFTRFRCDNGTEFILPMHQEKPIKFPKCPVTIDLCPTSIIEEQFKDGLNKCTYDKWCYLSKKEREEFNKMKKERKKRKEDANKKIVKKKNKETKSDKTIVKIDGKNVSDQEITEAIKSKEKPSSQEIISFRNTVKIPVERSDGKENLLEKSDTKNLEEIKIIMEGDESKKLESIPKYVTAT